MRIIDNYLLYLIIIRQWTTEEQILLLILIIKIRKRLRFVGILAETQQHHDHGTELLESIRYNKVRGRKSYDLQASSKSF